MMKWLKIENGMEIYAPATVTRGQTHYNPYPEALMREDGYKPLIDTEKPDEEEGFVFVPRVEENEDSFILVWDKISIDVSDNSFI